MRVAVGYGERRGRRRRWCVVGVLVGDVGDDGGDSGEAGLDRLDGQGAAGEESRWRRVMVRWVKSSRECRVDTRRICIE